MLEQKFTAPTLAEAGGKADDWLAKQQNVRQIGRREHAVRWGGPLLADVVEWAIVLYYEKVGDVSQPDATGRSKQRVNAQPPGKPGRQR
jgi:hypothetical protein